MFFFLEPSFRSLIADTEIIVSLNFDCMFILYSWDQNFIIF